MGTTTPMASVPQPSSGKRSFQRAPTYCPSSPIGKHTATDCLSKVSMLSSRTLRSTPTLIMTVDNGIVAESGVDYAKKKGIDVVICDHHEKSKHLPKALAIIHTTKLAGSGVSWIFARELLTDLTPKLPHRSSLDLATIGTVADMVPLLGANRAIVKEGLKELRETKRIGLRELFLEAQISPGEINTFHINFMIAPRLNAMGRLERATDALRLIRS